MAKVLVRKDRTIVGTASLSKRQRIIFKQFMHANRKILALRKIRKVDAVAIWLDGYVYGKYGQGWRVS